MKMRCKTTSERSQWRRRLQIWKAELEGKGTDGGLSNGRWLVVLGVVESTVFLLSDGVVCGVGSFDQFYLAAVLCVGAKNVGTARMFALCVVGR